MGFWLQAAINNKGKDKAFYENYTVHEIYKYIKGGNIIEKTKFIESFLNASDKNRLSEWLMAQKK